MARLFSFGATGWWRLGALLFLLCASLTARPAEAAPASVAQVPLRSCIAPMGPGDSAARMGDAPAKFDCDSAQSELGSGNFWVGLTPVQAAAMPASGQLRLALDWQSAITVHVRRRDGALWSQRIDATKLGAFTQIGPAVVVPLPDGASPVQEIIVAVEGAGNVAGVIPEASLITPAAAQAMERHEMAVVAGFVGLAGGLLVFNLVVWATLRERFQLFYCGMVAAMIGYALAYSGAIHAVIPGLDANIPFRLGYVTLSLATTMGLLFAINFFEAGVIPAWARRASAATVIAIMASGFGFALLAPQWIGTLDRLFLYCFVPAPLLLLTIFGYALRGNSPYAWLFVLAWSAPFVMMTMRILHAAHIIDFGFIMDHGTLLAMACESLLSSLAMSFRIKLIRRERDVARGEELYARRLAEVDAQTGLFNRRALLARALESSEPQALLVIDIDHFKQINDGFGHDVGDEVLRAVAALVADAAEEAGPKALAARLGGEEFAILMPTTAVPDRFAETIVRAIGAAPMPHGERVTVSIGTATGSIANESEWRAIYRGADQALYQAKNSGRDTVRHSWPTIAALAAA